MRSLTVLALLSATLFPMLAGAAADKPLASSDVKRSVAKYIAQRGMRPGRVGVRITGVTASGKSARAVLNIDGREVEVAVNRSGRVQPSSAAALNTALLAAHTPQQRAGLGKDSHFAVEVLGFRPGRNARLGDTRRALGRPRAGQLATTIALDAIPLGENGGIDLRLNTPIVAGRQGAALRVRENGLGSGSEIINQTPGLVSVSDGTHWYRVGYAGYKTQGDLLPLAQAMDPIPNGTVLGSVRVTDAPQAPHPHGFDPTDNATARLRGVGGFDLVSVEAVPGRHVATTVLP